jgi:hypothetical protein
MIVKLRYKTDAKPEDELQWRVLIDGIEHHASEVRIFCPSFTTKDMIDGVGEKWHMSCNANMIEWKNKICIIK